MELPEEEIEKILKDLRPDFIPVKEEYKAVVLHWQHKMTDVVVKVKPPDVRLEFYTEVPQHVKGWRWVNHEEQIKTLISGASDMKEAIDFLGAYIALHCTPKPAAKVVKMEM